MNKDIHFAYHLNLKFEIGFTVHLLNQLERIIIIIINNYDNLCIFINYYSSIFYIQNAFDNNNKNNKKLINTSKARYGNNHLNERYFMCSDYKMRMQDELLSRSIRIGINYASHGKWCSHNSSSFNFHRESIRSSGHIIAVHRNK